jgi:hypothetical protein
LGPHDIPAIIRSTGTGSYNSTSGAGVEVFWNGTSGFIQCLDRAGGGQVLKPFAIQACSQIQLNPTGNLLLNGTGHLYCQPNGNTFLYRPSLQTAFLANSYHFDTMYVDDWLRPSGSGLGMYNPTHNQGVGIGSSGGYDYTSGRILAKLPVVQDMAVGDIVNFWYLHSAPAGSTASGTDTLMPYGTIACTGYTGGRFIMVFDFELTVSGTPTQGTGVSISLYLNSADANMRYSHTCGQITSGSPFQVSGTYMYNAGTYAALNLQFYWHLLSGGQININTGVYSKIWIAEFKK